MVCLLRLHVGYTGGSWFDHLGAAVEPLCLPRDPEWGNYKDGRDRTKAFVFGAEYHMGYSSSLDRQDVPCAVCLVHNKSVVKMFPGNLFQILVGKLQILILNKNHSAFKNEYCSTKNVL